MSNYIWYVKNEFVSSDKAVIPITDLSVVRGYGVFDFLRTYNGKPFHLKDHITRLKNSASYIGMQLPMSEEKIEEIILETLKKNNLPESNIKILLTGGPTSDGILPTGNPIFAVLVTPAEFYPKEYYEKGVKVVTMQYERTIPEAKTLNYLQAVIAMQSAYKKNAVEMIYLDRNNNVLEPTRSNVFIVKNGELLTPKVDILIGVTRKVIIDIVGKKFTIKEQDFTLDEMYNADEVFMTASNKEVMPVYQVDDKTIAEGAVGPITKEIMKMFKEYTDAFAKS